MLCSLAAARVAPSGVRKKKKFDRERSALERKRRKKDVLINRVRGDPMLRINREIHRESFWPMKAELLRGILMSL